MARILCVHGIGNTYLTALQMESTWAAALLGGIGLADPQSTVDVDDLSWVAYGDLFRPAGKFLGGGDGQPSRPLDELETEMLLQWWQAAAVVDSQVVPPDATVLGTRSSVRAAFLALAGSRHLAGGAERLLRTWLWQVTRYFTDTDTRAAIQKRWAAAVAADTRVVVAHSLGSVVAYEALCAGLGAGVTDLVTLGSPLGIPRMIFDRLAPPPHRIGRQRLGRWPGNVLRWVNITESGDFVALQPRLRTVFGKQVVDVQISNGMRSHQVDRYLSAAETGAAVLAGLTGHG